VFDEAMHARAMQRLELETGPPPRAGARPAAGALSAVIETATGNLAGFEALCRWSDATGTPIEPREFVPIADETGLILPLGRFVLGEACRQLAVWRKHPRGQHISVSVNVSQRQLADPGFVDLVTGALADARLDPRGLRLEVARAR
jgi:Amt family ammonium transporter